MFLRSVIDSPGAVLLSETDRPGVRDSLATDAEFHRFRGLWLVDLQLRGR